MSPASASSIDPKEVEQFSRIAAEWWDPKGKFAPLHKFNPVRLSFIRDQVQARFGRDPKAIRPFEGLRLLDIGCGGGLLCEPMTRLGFQVTGVDASERNIGTASAHAAEQGLSIDYRATTAEALAAEGHRYDVVMALEIVEHVADPAEFIATCRDLVAPGGMLIASTLNRTAKSFAAAIIGAEWVMRWLPKGTHDWQRFITPDELTQMAEATGLTVVDRCGMVFNPLGWSWSLSHRDLSVNYALTALRAA